ncbi:hypothetical protein ASPTUDRAFT_78848 [Aspergillus tubingensis CBS 134.48]|uniref:Uncharacterized protein n=1 Tax=Aspergillus tubingensis (strain CBS 134.48) TaxID=767770 RepID=A0A1L9MQY8_ASPTC|nr:hypothetical protein ASPTUDRAFT_78848 [Aspergillus tubingensis CBS 134.48]
MDYPRQFLWMCWMATQEGGRWEDDGTSVARAESDGKGKEKDGRKAGQPPPPKVAPEYRIRRDEKGRIAMVVEGVGRGVGRGRDLPDRYAPKNRREMMRIDSLYSPFNPFFYLRVAFFHRKILNRIASERTGFYLDLRDRRLCLEGLLVENHVQSTCQMNR